MLNFFTTSNGFRSTLPVVSNLTAMNVWDGVCMCFIYASLLEFVCVNYVGRKRPLHNVVYRPGENPVTQVNSITMQAKSTENAKTNKNHGPLSRGCVPCAVCRVPQICYASQAIKYEFYISVQPKKQLQPQQQQLTHRNNNNKRTTFDAFVFYSFTLTNPTKRNDIKTSEQKSSRNKKNNNNNSSHCVASLCLSISIYLYISLYLSLSFSISLSKNHIFICLLLSFCSLSVLTT